MKAHISKSFLTLRKDVPPAPKLLGDANGMARPRGENCNPVNISVVSRVKPKPNNLTGLRPHFGNANEQPVGLLSDAKYPPNKPLIPLPDVYNPQLNSKINRD